MELDTGFRPSRDGFGFPNSWKDTLLGVIPSRGRCGGMVFAALDAFRNAAPLEQAARARDLPAHDTPLARAIWRRQLESVIAGLGTNLLNFARFTYLPAGSRMGVGIATRRELLTIFDVLRAGFPAPLGMVSTLGAGGGLRGFVQNHQVLAYAADFGKDRVLLRVYDPNHPGRDDVTIEVPISPSLPVVEHIGTKTKKWRGLFVERYAPRRHAAASEGVRE